jgi:hypothetical protein
MKRLDLAALLKRLHPGMTISEVAKHLGSPYQITRRLVLRHGYHRLDGRRFAQQFRRLLDPNSADWKKSNLQLARQFLVSKQRVSIVRKQFINSKIPINQKPK